MQVEGLPDWVNSTLYAIDARTDISQSAAMMQGPMMQALLEERFALKVHREKREGPAYLLTVAKSPLKLHKTAEGTCEPYDFSERLNMTCTGQTFWTLPVMTRRNSLTILDIHGITLGAFAKTLHPEGHPVIDQTGLDGAFDLHLEWGPDAPDQSAPPGVSTGVASDPSPGAPSFMAAIREQLGLELKIGRGISEFLVIDRIAKAREN